MVEGGEGQAMGLRGTFWTGVGQEEWLFVGDIFGNLSRKCLGGRLLGKFAEALNIAGVFAAVPVPGPPPLETLKDSPAPAFETDTIHPINLHGLLGGSDRAMPTRRYTFRVGLDARSNLRHELT